MFTVSEYLKKLLIEQDCVVVPDLGGFLAHSNSSFYSEQNSLYYPLSKKIAFNEALKLDDGLITHYIAVNENMSRENAQAKIHDFVLEIRNEIQLHGHYVIDGLGKIMVNLEGKFYFEPELNANFHEDGYGLKTISVNSFKQSVKTIEDYTESDTVDRTPVILVQENKHRTRTKKVMYASGLLLLGTLFYANNGLEPSNSSKGSLNPFDVISTSKSKVVDPATKVQVIENENFKPISLTTEIKPEAPATIALPKKDIQLKHEKINDTKESITEKKTPIITNKSKIDNVDSDKIETVIRKDSDEKASYFVIAGAFSKQENAQKLTEKLISRGYKNAYMMNIDERNLYKVSAIGLSSQQRALNHFNKINKISNANAWIYHVD